MYVYICLHTNTAYSQVLVFFTDMGDWSSHLHLRGDEEARSPSNVKRKTGMCIPASRYRCAACMHAAVTHECFRRLELCFCRYVMFVFFYPMLIVGRLAYVYCGWVSLTC